MSTPSLLNIPYVIKAGTLYSQIPETGAGDFVVSRTTSPATNRSTRVNANGFIETVADNVPRLDYPLGGAVNGCPALLVEPSATNLVPNGLGYNASTGVLYNTTVTDSPAVGINSARITKNEAAGNIQYANQTCSSSALSANTTYTISQFFKFDGHTFATSMEYNSSTQWGGTGWIQVINIASSGVTLGTSANCTGSVENYGNGWYRVAVRITTGASISGGTPVVYLMRLPSALSTGQGMLTALPQLEVGSVATSYIPTTTQAITRGAEVINKTNVASLIGQSEGTIYWEGEIPSIGVAGGLFLEIGSSPERVYIVRETSGLVIQLGTQSSAGYNFKNQTVTSNLLKIAIGYASGNNAFYVNGVQVSTASATANPSAAMTLIKLTSSTSLCRIRASAIFPNRLSNSELIALTTP